jgi:hypothetical protein
MKWNSKFVKYGLAGDNVDVDELRALVQFTLDKFKDVFGTLITWEEDTDLDHLAKYDRYVLFILAKHGCGIAFPTNYGPSLIELARQPCSVDIGMAQILKVLGKKFL